MVTWCCQPWYSGALILLGDLVRYLVDFVSLGLETSFVQSENQEKQRLITGKSRILIGSVIGVALLLGLAMWKRQPGDLAGGASTEEMGDAICSKL